MNFVFAWVVFSILFAIGVAPVAINTKFATSTETLLIPSPEKAKAIGLLTTSGVILAPIKDSPAEKSGIQNGDEVVSVNGNRIDSPEAFVAYFQAHSTETAASLALIRQDRALTISVTPKDGKIGAYVAYKTIAINNDFRYQFPVVTALHLGAQEVYGQSCLTFELFTSLVRKLVTPTNPEERKEAVESLSGPIGIGNLFIDLAKTSAPFSLILVIAALISINLGVFNLLPFPALDGGRFAFLTIETVVRTLSYGKLKGDKLESSVHAIGFALLILLSIFVAYQDIARIFIR